MINQHVWWYINIDWYNGLVPSGNIPVPNLCWPRSMSSYDVAKSQWDEYFHEIGITNMHLRYSYLLDKHCGMTFGNKDDWVERPGCLMAAASHSSSIEVWINGSMTVYLIVLLTYRHGTRVPITHGIVITLEYNTATYGTIMIKLWHRSVFERTNDTPNFTFPRARNGYICIVSIFMMNAVI